MKVLQVTTHMNTGGIANYILSLGRFLKKGGAEVLVASSGGALERELASSGIAHKRLGLNTKFEFGPKVLRSIFKIARIVKDEKVDIIHGHTRVAQSAGFFASRIADVAFVTTCHGFFRKRFGRRIFDLWGDKVIAISESVRRSLIADFNVSPNRIALIHNGVDVEAFLREYPAGEVRRMRDDLHLGGVPVVGTIGRLSPVKGQILLIEALAHLASKNCKVEGLIVGSGPEERALRAAAADFGISDHVHFIKSVPDTRPYLAVMDIFVFPSLQEGLGLALLEAMASSRPCAASDTGGIADIITDGENGMLFPAGDAGALADTIVNLLQDEPLRKRLASAARALVSRDFSIEEMAKDVMKLYEEALAVHANK